MAQTTNWTGNAGDGLWETAGNWDNGVPVSASGTVVVMTVDNSGAGMSGPVLACTIGSLTLSQASGSNFDNDFSNLTVLSSFSLSAQGPGATSTINLDAAAVSGATISNADFGGSVGDNFTVNTNSNFSGTGGNFGTLDGEFDSSGRTNSSGVVGHGCQFVNGAENGGTAGDSTYFSGANNIGDTGDYTQFSNSSANAFDPNSGAPTSGSTGNHTIYDSGSQDYGTDSGDVTYNDDAQALLSNVSGVATFNDRSSATGGLFASDINWNSTGPFQSDYARLTASGTITATTDLTMSSTGYALDVPITIIKDLLDITIILNNYGPPLNISTLTIEDSMTSSDLISSIGSALIASGIPSSGLMTQAKTDVQTAAQAGMTSQGYTTARGAKLDNLDAAVSSRSTFGGGAVASVTSPVTVGTLPNPAPAGYGAQASAGSDLCTLTLSDGATPTPNPIGNSSVWISTDSAGDDVVAGTRNTDSNGRVQFLLTAGDTYYLWMERDGFNPILGQSFVAVADS